MPKGRTLLTPFSVKDLPKVLQTKSDCRIDNLILTDESWVKVIDPVTSKKGWILGTNLEPIGGPRRKKSLPIDPIERPRDNSLKDSKSSI